MHFFFKHKRWLWPLIFIIFLTPFTPWLDLSIESYFYSHGNDPGTHFMTSPFIEFMYHYAIWIPNVIAGVTALFLFSRKWRKSAVAILLTLMIGAGLITHAILKDNWGRPRPKQIEAFGGMQTFIPYWKPNFEPSEPSKSFTCGHCSVGFFFAAYYLIGQRMKSRFLVVAGALCAIFFGVALSYIRMAQGGHFLSDTLFSALIMWWTALSMTWLVWADENTH